MRKRFSLVPVCSVVALFFTAAVSSAAVKTLQETPKPSVQEPVGETASPDLGGSLSLGYGSRYEYRGMVVNSADSNGGLVFEGEASYETDQMLAPVMSVTYRDMKVMNTEGQVNFFAGVQNMRLDEESEGSPVSVCKLGYQLVNGGLPGVMKGWEKGRDLETDGGTTQEFMLNMAYFRSLSSSFNFFTNYSAGYSFSGLTGWVLSAAAGVEYVLTDKISATLAANVSWSFSYWTPDSGCDQLNLIFTLPMQASENCTVSPFAMTEWGARGAKMINHQTERDVVENFSVVAGVRCTFTF